MIKRYLYFLIILILGCSPKSQENKLTKPKNIILLIGDGMGLAQAYSVMANPDTMNIERMPVTGFSKTSSATDKVTDSGAGATAISTGKKTFNYSIGVGVDSLPLKTILEIAEENGLSTGLIATVNITHATPASFIAHQIDRGNYEDIALDFLKTDIDLFIGGGRLNFEERADSLNLSDSLRARGYQVIYDTNQVKSLTRLKVAGLLADEYLPPMPVGRGNVLPLSVEKALPLLSANPKGFFIMIEGSQIDWACHSDDPEYLISEVHDFDQAVGKALEFAKKDGNTLVIVTADHETGGVTLQRNKNDNTSLLINFSTDDHTGVMVPVYAYGPGSEKFTGIYENTELFKKMISFYGF